MSEPLLRVENLTAGYGPITAVREVSLEVRHGQIVALLGANGAGKTSLLRALCGVVKPRSGAVTFNGAGIAGLRPAEIAALGVGHVPEGREIFPQLTVRENLRMGAYLRRDREIAADLERVFARFPVLRERAATSAGLLSGGQQQMLAFARAAMARPTLLLMDEPSLGLSPRLTQEMFAAIAHYRREDGPTVLLVEQNVGLSLKIADYVYVMETGRVVASGPPERFAGGDIARYYLGAV